MTTTRVFVEDSAIVVPDWVADLESFRRWSDDDAFPESGRVSFLKGEVWIDMSKEQLFSHNEVKKELARVLGGLVKAAKSGRYFTDGAFLSNVEADVSNQPEGIFVATATLREGVVRIVEGRAEGHVELEGTPDMVAEVVSRSSVEKDTEVLRRAYALAGIREYWLIDARDDPPRFDLLRLGRGGYKAARKRGGWTRSDVFSHWFRLIRQPGADGYPEFTLEASAKQPG